MSSEIIYKCVKPFYIKTSCIKLLKTCANSYPRIKSVL